MRNIFLKIKDSVVKKRNLALIIASCSIIFITGCSTKAGTGALVGGGAGAVVGGIVGGSRGAAIGTAVGSVSGAAIGANEDRKDRHVHYRDERGNLYYIGSDGKRYYR